MSDIGDFKDMVGAFVGSQGASTAASEQQASVSEADELLKSLWGDTGLRQLMRPDHVVKLERRFSRSAALSGRATIPSEADERARQAVFRAYGECNHAGCRLTPNEIADKLIAAALTHRATTAPPGHTLVPIKITPEMIESALVAHYGKRRVAAAGGPDGIDMTVNDVNYSGTQAMRNFWRGALTAVPDVATTVVCITCYGYGAVGFPPDRYGPCPDCNNNNDPDSPVSTTGGDSKV